MEKNLHVQLLKRQLSGSRMHGRWRALRGRISSHSFKAGLDETTTPQILGNYHSLDDKRYYSTLQVLIWHADLRMIDWWAFELDWSHSMISKPSWRWLQTKFFWIHDPALSWSPKWLLPLRQNACRWRGTSGNGVTGNAHRGCQTTDPSYIKCKSKQCLFGSCWS